MNPHPNPNAGLIGIALAAVLLGSQARAQGNSPGWEVGAVLDVAATSSELAFGQRDKGLGLGHSDLIARGPLGQHFSAQGTLVAHTSHGKLEAEIEEAWLQTRTLPSGWQVRLGRFSSQIGYLNEQHPHSDDFVERPLLYRAFLGGHWFDDGARVNWTAPTPFYLNLGAEVFRGHELVPDTASRRNPGAMTLSARLGGDIGNSHAWQFGLSYLRNRREMASDEAHGAAHGEEEHDDHDDHDGHDDHDDDHAHSHGARFSGRNMVLVDAVWKWAPDGNNRERQLRVVAEYARVTGLNRYASGSDRHEAMGVSAVWRFSQQFEIGARTDWLRALAAHEDHFDPVRLREHAVMLAWKPSHAQVLRLQYTTQRNAVRVENPGKRAVQLQYVLSFGAHGAHAF